MRGHYEPERVKRVCKKLKKVLAEEFREEVRLGVCQSAIAEGLDFASSSDMFASLPSCTEWRRGWCVANLEDSGALVDPRNADPAVARVEELLSGFFTTRPPAPCDVRSLYA